MKRNWCLSALIGSMMAAAPVALADGDIGLGVSAVQDGSFNYQGYLEFEGAPANGDFYFEVHLLDSNGDEIDPRFDQPGPITVTDGLFDMDIQMGGTLADADYFWDRYGHLAKKMRIMVGLIEGGPYTTLSPDVELGASPHALWSRYAGGLQFPYTDTHSNLFADPETMISLTNEFGGTVAELRSNGVTNEPIVYIRGERVFGGSFGFQSGALLVDSREDEVGIRGEGTRFSVVGFFSDPPTLTGVSAALLGSVGFASAPDVVAVWASNTPAGTSARLGTADYAGDFDGDILARDDLRVQGEPTRDYSASSPSPIGPLAYGFVSSSGTVSSATANLSASWDAANSRYLIEVEGESFGFNTHAVSITVVDSVEPRIATYDGTLSALGVKIWDLNSGNIAVQDNFSIVIYDATPVVVNQVAVPEGMDKDKYTEKTGVQLLQTRPRHEPIEQVENFGNGVSIQD